jgi:hypothetical protein
MSYADYIGITTPEEIGREAAEDEKQDLFNEWQKFVGDSDRPASDGWNDLLTEREQLREQLANMRSEQLDTLEGINWRHLTVLRELCWTIDKAPELAEVLKALYLASTMHGRINIRLGQVEEQMIGILKHENQAVKQ